ncbi:MAG: glycine C-acetyltransferase [Spirochaetes bacterium]|nr:glycine C-acetyltransferase [Spirochaetota bacterium]
MFGKMKNDIKEKLKEVREQGLYKDERVLLTAQGAEITVAGVAGRKKVLNFCSNNYLGLSGHPEIVKAAKDAMDRWGYGLSSVRFICGTQDIHKELEAEVSGFLGTEDTLLYAACFDANGGLFEPFLDEHDAVISDELNHASIIDGVRLCRASRYRYKHSNIKNLEDVLREASKARYRLICTDGVFSMDGDIADLKGICDLADKYDALVMVDDSHATGYIGKTGRGTPEYCGVQGRVDLITTTFGKALGGASGGCTSGRRELIEYLRQRSRPYLFSNTLPPGVAGATLKALKMIEESSEPGKKVSENADYFKEKMKVSGFDIVPGNTAIVPIMLYKEQLALTMAEKLLDKGVYVTGFAYPVVPKGRARIRVQLSAAHTKEQIDRAADAFKKAGKELGIV